MKAFRSRRLNRPFHLKTLSTLKSLTKKKQVRKTSTIVRHIINDEWQDYSKYTYEFYWCGFFAVTILVFLKGRAANDDIANTWNKAVADSVSSNFSHFGTLKDPSLALE